MIRVLITGSRDWWDVVTIQRALAYYTRHYSSGEVVVVHGGARGADQTAHILAEEMGFAVERYPADWDRYGRRAGFVRNAEMVKRGADICLAFIRNNSRGASMCADLAEQAGIRTVRIRENT